MPFFNIPLNLPKVNNIISTYNAINSAIPLASKYTKAAGYVNLNKMLNSVIPKNLNSLLGTTGASYFTGTDRKEYPKDFCFIRVIDVQDEELDLIPFQFMPRSISDVKAALYNDIQIVGRSSPFKNYSSSSARGVAFALEFYANPETQSKDMDPSDIKRYVDRLQSLVYPIYSEYAMMPPPRCIVKVGDQISMIGVCKSVSVSYNNQVNPWTTKRQGLGRYSFGAAVQLTFEEVKDIPIGYYEKKAGQDDKFVRPDIDTKELEAKDAELRAHDEMDFKDEAILNGTLADAALKKEDYYQRIDEMELDIMQPYYNPEYIIR